ncbi:UvrD-helicase domain-containing protein [Streptomyces sp. NPDC089799]|uniref:UvrD-helicase domain-containing protein n=1 Tax=Streptomyces sp. NPDC089799 TaxID=3155066 RepID=UPI0034248B45
MACITAPAAPQVIVAGAGSGKTTVMAARVVWLVGTGTVAPEQVLGLTFTNKAAAELAERVRKALAKAGITDPDPSPADGGGVDGGVVGEPRISTYHAFAGQLLKDHGLRIGLEPSSRLLADATRFQLAARVLREAPGPYPSLTKSVPDLVSDLLALDAELSEHLVAPDGLRAYDTALLDALAGARLTNDDLRKVPEAARGRLELLELVGRYRAAKRSRDLFDFSDQIALSAELATTRPEVGGLLREEFRIVLLDEYQDTSVAQRLLLSGLFGGGTGHAVTAVGDPCQAIYGWRGASVANLDDFPEHFPHADGTPATRYSLSENRRSGGRLLDLANTLAAPLRSMHAGVEALRPAEGAEHTGFVRCALLDTHAEELAWLADSVAHQVRTGKEPRDVAVLCRSGADFAAIQAALVARDVPVEVVGLSGLLHLPEVADLVSVCEVLQDPGANAALVRLLIGPRWRIGARDLALLGRRARLLVSRQSSGAGDDPDLRLAAAVEGVDPAEIISLADALDTFLDGAGAGAGAGAGSGGGSARSGGGADDGLPFSAEARVRFAHLAQELRDLRRSLSDPLMDVLHRVLATTGLDVELAASPHALAARRRETLSNFLDVAAGFAALDGEASLLAFLSFLRTAERYEKGLDNALPGGENTVKVLTAHKSKGLEWDVVAVPGLYAGAFPSEQPREAWTSYARVLPHALRGDAATLPADPPWTAAGLKAFRAGLRSHQQVEELRLGYVTFTRPKSLLLASAHWWGPTQKRRRGPSDFLTALREHCGLPGRGEVEVWADEPEADAENPALTGTTDEHRSWPLPLDPASLRLRRAAAALVESHLSAPPEDPYLWPPSCEDPAYEEEPQTYGDADDLWAADEAGQPTVVPPRTGAGAVLPASADGLGGPGLPVAEAFVVRARDAAADAPDDDLWGPEAAVSGAGAPVRSGAGAAVPPARDGGTLGLDPWAADGDGPAAGLSARGADGFRGGAPVSGRGGVGDRSQAPAGAGLRRSDDLWADGLVPEEPAYGDDPWSGSHEDGRAGIPAHGGEHGEHRRRGVQAAGGAHDDPWAGDSEDGPAHRDDAPADRHGDAAAGDPARGSRRAVRGRRGELPRPRREAGGDRLAPEELRAVDSWDRDLDALTRELRRTRAAVRDVPLPASLSASDLLRLAADEEAFVRELARPMPKPPQPAARQGTRFHAWVESRFEDLPLPLLDVLDPAGDLPGSDQEVADAHDLEALKAAFERSEYADRTPHLMEVPVQLTLAGRVVRGRIDAVYATPGGGFEIVDWKTGRSADADPLQLAIYRLAWAETTGTPLEKVTAAFLHVRSGRVVRPRNLPTRERLERILLGGADPAGAHQADS